MLKRFAWVLLSGGIFTIQLCSLGTTVMLQLLIHALRVPATGENFALGEFFPEFWRNRRALCLRYNSSYLKVLVRYTICRKGT